MDGDRNAPKLVNDIKKEEESHEKVRRYLGDEKWSQSVNYWDRTKTYTSK
jgi:hypothetical protein